MSKIHFSLMLISLVISLALISICQGASLIWDENSESDLAGYKVYYKISSGYYESVIDVGRSTEHKLRDINEGVTYYIAVTAYDTSGNEGTFSSEVEYYIEDGIPDDGDNSGTVGDNPCTGGDTENCDDNCPLTPNGPEGGTCTRMLDNIVTGTGVVCTDDTDCRLGGTCQMNQEDFNNNGIGDVCECYGDANKDGYVMGGDISLVDNEYARIDCPIIPELVVPGADTDSDGVEDNQDNCPNHPNGGTSGTCVRILAGMVVSYRVGGSFVTCTEDEDCTGPGTKWCEKTNSDCNDNGIGDVCECYGDANKDGYVLGGDSALVDNEYGRTNCAVIP